MKIQGIKRGKTIELHNPLDLPDGSEVVLHISPKLNLSLAERKKRLQNRFGAWSNQPNPT